ncbi:subfamily B ATP-binding cassette protein MsbA [Evansella vedderi]|uniref:Subfamily B ATP-binding cassette protein MsbA n=1 Tax=Evansella vedderi TaxID=38282 RepID=A0ABT9ZPU0_9BACI|nr:ABC transporter ATP-binding protein [Evansella vedderi]MDQ0253219.1 subfamily B ATP-binding cassette protein MsbA [Evansella vedderi]
MDSDRKVSKKVMKEEMDRKKLLRKYWRFIRPYRFVFMLIIVLGILQLAVPLIAPYITGIVLIDHVFEGEGSWTLEGAVLVLLIVFLFGVTMEFIRNYVTAKLGNRMVVDIRQKLYQHLQLLSPKFYDNKHVGGVVSRVLNDVNGAQNLVQGGVINIIVDLFVVFFAAAMLFVLDWRLALLALWILPMYYLTFTNLNVRIRFAWRSVHRQMERISAVLVERISGIKIVQAFNREKTEMKRYDKQAKQHFNYAMKAHILSNILGRITQSFNHIGTVIVWFVGGLFVMRGEFTVGGLVAFQAYLMQMYRPIQRFAEVNVTIQNSMANVERIFEVFDYDVDILNREDAKPLKHSNGELVFNNVSFVYQSERPIFKNRDKDGDPDIVEEFKADKKFFLVPPKIPPRGRPEIEGYEYEEYKALKNISFHAKPGEVIALVGSSGAGKSTLANLIPRFYDPDQGEILLDRVNIKNYDLYDLRKQIALVLQDNVLFSGTVYENIAYGRPEASKEEVIQAAKAANVHNFIMELKNNYDSILGERGMRLSGGQKQRVAIARALLKDPRILILDEATSALDAESEALVTAALEKLMENRTTIVIAHRLATVVRADQILVLERGEIVEHGTHKELLQLNGVYRNLYEKQLKAMKPDELENVHS